MFETSEATEGDATAEVRAALEKLQKPKTNWTQGLIVLAVSIFLFSAAGFLGDGMDWTFLGVLVAVVFIHELGHLAAMWWFDYQDLRMFFIPFFGAAASGRKRTATGVQRAIVSLAGPVPGIVFGCALGLLWFANGDELTGMFALLFLALNVLNLLPVMPLDGGRFFDTILFSRWPGFQLAVNIMTGGLLAVGGYAIGDWIFVGLGAMLLLFSGTGFKIARLGKRLRAELPADVRAADDIPDDHLELLAERVRTEVLPGNATKPKLVAQYLDMVWQSVHSEPPRAGATWLLLVVYGFALVGIPAVGVTVAVLGPDVMILDGTPSKVVRSFWGRTLWEAELDSEGRYHGRYLEYSLVGETALITGNYVDGFRDGAWTQFDEEGAPVAEATLAAGVFVSARCLTEGEWNECAFDELPIDLLASMEAHQYDAKTVTGDERRETR